MSTSAASSSSELPPRPPRALRPKTSLTLRKDRILTVSPTKPPVDQPSSPHKPYFERYPQRVERIQAEKEGRQQDGNSSSSSTRKLSVPDLTKERERLKPSSYAFPAKSGSSGSESLPSTSPPRRRRRSSGSKSRRKVSPPNRPLQLDSPPPVPPIRLTSNIRVSISSTHTSTDPGSFTPPRTPTPSPQSESSVVIAPTSSVENMDALVDQMNGDHDDDTFMFGLDSWGNSPATRSKRRHQHQHHPLYHPPLPSPPRGVKLGNHMVDGSPTASTPTKYYTASPTSLDIEPTTPPITIGASLSTKRRSTITRNSPAVSGNSPSSSLSRSPAMTNIAAAAASPSLKSSTSSSRRPSKGEPSLKANPSMEEIVHNYVTRGDPPKPQPKSTVPSINDIIRTHAPEYAIKPPRKSFASTRSSAVSSYVPPSPTPERDEDDRIESRSARSSIDSIVEEAIQTAAPSRSLQHARSFPTRPSHPPSVPVRTHTAPASEANAGFRNSSYHSPLPSPRSEGYNESIYSSPAAIISPPPPPPTFLMPPIVKQSATNEMAQYLRSPRLTRLLTLRRHPHTGLTVSLADVGSSNGRPVFVHLGLGCVRYLVALYDEMAEALNLRLICVDRWGLGRTGEVPQEKRSLLDWAGVIEEVADVLGIERFSVMAHSAGAPYALASTLRSNDRVRGYVHLLAPWVSMAVDGGYKWLKYVPSSIIKTAQAAEWKMQGWMIGKPPTISYGGIGYDVRAPVSNVAVSSGSPVRESFSTSEYDDLADFEGKFSSTSPPQPVGFSCSNDLSRSGCDSQQQARSGQSSTAKRKASKGFLSLFESKSSSSRSSSLRGPPTQPPSPNDTEFSSKGSPKLKGLRSMSSLRSNSTATTSTKKRVTSNLASLNPRNDDYSDDSPQQIESPQHLSVSEWGKIVSAATATGDMWPPPPSPQESSYSFSSNPSRARRSLSLTTRPIPSLPPSSVTGGSTKLHRRQSSQSATSVSAPSTINQKSVGISLASALLRASHAESLKGGTADLLSILERGDSRPWGFSYTDVNHSVKVWYGDKDEKIGISSVRWMERVMKDCTVTIVEGGDHSLLTNAKVVVEVLESIARDWDGYVAEAL